MPAVEHQVRSGIAKARMPRLTTRQASVAALVALLGPGSAWANDLEFGKCRAVPEPAARLACYDAIPHAVAPPGAQASPAGAAPRRAQPVAPQGAADRFGLARRTDQEELPSITSAVGAGFFGWGPGERIRLENGQVWEVVDGSTGAIGRENRKVTVRRGALGSFFLEFEGLNTSPRVTRLR